jgi:signal transduction histidine kinase/ligand-binding sensor domain-containing protein/DNA-binding response OmpR family regulator
MIYIVCLFYILFYQDKDVTFRPVNDNSNFNHLNINTINQDYLGFLWIGTTDGLIRYDGTEFIEYAVEPFSNIGISDNFIKVIYEDKQKKLWIGTQRGGLYYYKRENDSFHVFANIADKNIQAIYEDSKDYLWIGTQHGLEKIDSNRTNISRFFYADMNKKEFKTRKEISENTYLLDEKNGVSAIAEWESKLLLLTNEKLFILQNNEFKQVKNLNNIKPDYWNLKVRKKLILLGTSSGLYQSYDLFKTKDKLLDYGTFNFFVNWKNDLWAATEKGLFYRSENDEKLNKLTDASQIDKLSMVRTVFQDKSFLLWCGTSTEGLYNLFTNELRSSKLNVKTGKIYQNPIHFIIPDLAGSERLWVQFADRLVLFNVDFEREVLSFPGIANTIFQTRALDYWLVLNKKIIHYNVKGFIKSYDMPELTTASTSIMYEEDKVLFGNGKKGLYTFDLSKVEIKAYSLEVNKIIRNRSILSLIYSLDHIWIGTDNGLFLLDINTKKITKKYISNIDDPMSLSNNVILSLMIDTDMQLWVGTEAGLNILSKDSLNFSQITKENNLINNKILGIHETENSKIVVYHRLGLSIIDKKSKKIINYSTSDGFDNSFEHINSSTLFKYSQIIVGGNKGLTRFYIHLKESGIFLPDVHITKIETQDKKSEIANTIYKNTFMQDSIIIPYDNNTLHLEFSSLDFTSPQKNRYKYFLEGYDSFWSREVEKNKVVYANIPSGNYIFRVKGTNSKGEWSNREAKLHIQILRPYWETVWFITLMIMAVFSLIYYIYKLRLQVLQRKNLELEQLILKRTDALEQKTRELERVNQLKTNFFTTVSHELRTPLTLILAPLESVFNEMKNSKLRKKLNYAFTNGKRLKQLINQLLDFSKIDDGSFKAQMKAGDFVSFLKLISEQFSIYAEQHKIEIKFQSEIDVLHVYFDPKIMEHIFYNLISNALKYARSEVVLSIKEENEKIYVGVYDNGEGIPEAERNQIFNRFYRVNPSDNTGLGIGLSITKELATEHKGSITVESERDKWTEFKLCFNLEKAERVEEMNDVSDSSIYLPVDLEKANKVKHKLTDTRIHIVEDNPDMRQYLQSELELRYTIDLSKDGLVAFDRIVQEMPDLIITDLMMPGKDGISLIKEIRSDIRISHIPIILLTARGGKDDKLEGYGSGATHFIQKPFSIDELKAIIFNIFNERETLWTFFKLNHLTEQESTVFHKDLFLNKLEQMIKERISESDLSIDALGSKLHMSRSSFYRKVKAITGLTSVQFLRYYRLNHAKNLIETTGLSVSEVAYQSGFRSLSYFSKTFQQEFNFPPNSMKSNL